MMMDAANVKQVWINILIDIFDYVLNYVMDDVTLCTDICLCMWKHSCIHLYMLKEFMNDTLYLFMFFKCLCFFDNKLTRIIWKFCVIYSV